MEAFVCFYLVKTVYFILKSTNKQLLTLFETLS